MSLSVSDSRHGALSSWSACALSDSKTTPVETSQPGSESQLCYLPVCDLVINLSQPLFFQS